MCMLSHVINRGEIPFGSPRHIVNKMNKLSSRFCFQISSPKTHNTLHRQHPQTQDTMSESTHARVSGRQMHVPARFVNQGDLGAAAAMLRFFSGHSSCTAVPQETMGKPSRNRFTNTNRANQIILRDSSILPLPLSLCISLSSHLRNTRAARGRSKHLGQFVERVFIHAIHLPKEPPRCAPPSPGAEPEGVPRFLRSAMAQPISRLPQLLSATCGMAYDALMSPLCAGATQIWKGLQKLGS